MSASPPARSFQWGQVGVALLTAGALLMPACTSSDRTDSAGSTTTIGAGVTSTTSDGVVSTDSPETGSPPVDRRTDLTRARRPTTDATGGPPLADLRSVATPEQAYALSLPVLEHWLENDFEHAWIVTANTIEAAAAALDYAALDDTDYAEWVETFRRLTDVATAVAGGDRDAALAAFAPLIAEEPGPYVDAVVDRAMSATPYRDAGARLDALDAAILAEDRDAARVAAGDTAEALAELVLTAQLDVPTNPAGVLAAMLPALQAINQIHDDVLTGTAKDAADEAALLRASYESFAAAYPELSQ